MKTFGSIAVILVALAGILGLSIVSGMREQERLVDDFTQATRQQAHASVEVLSARLDALDQDTRLLSDLVERSDGARSCRPATDLGSGLPCAGRGRRAVPEPSR